MRRPDDPHRLVLHVPRLRDQHRLLVPLEELDDDTFRAMAKQACDEFATHTPSRAEWEEFAERLRFVPQSEGASALSAAVKQATPMTSSAVYAVRPQFCPPPDCVDANAEGAEEDPDVAGGRVVALPFVEGASTTDIIKRIKDVNRDG